MTPAEVLLPCPEGTQVGEASMTKAAEALCITNSEQRGLPPDPTKMVVPTTKKERRALCRLLGGAGRGVRSLADLADHHWAYGGDTSFYARSHQ